MTCQVGTITIPALICVGPPAHWHIAYSYALFALCRWTLFRSEYPWQELMYRVPLTFLVSSLSPPRLPPLSLLLAVHCTLEAGVCLLSVRIAVVQLEWSSVVRLECCASCHVWLAWRAEGG